MTHNISADIIGSTILQLLCAFVPMHHGFPAVHRALQLDRLVGVALTQGFQWLDEMVHWVRLCSKNEYQDALIAITERSVKFHGTFNSQVSRTSNAHTLNSVFSTVLDFRLQNRQPVRLLVFCELVEIARKDFLKRPNKEKFMSETEVFDS